MASPFDLTSYSAFEAARLASGSATTFSAFQVQARALDSLTVRRFLEEARRDDAMRQALFGGVEFNDQLSRFVRLQAEQDRRWQTILRPGLFDEQLQAAAKLAHSFALPKAMGGLQNSVDQLANKLTGLHNVGSLLEPCYLEAFNRTSAFSDVFIGSGRIDQYIRNAKDAFLLGSIPEFPDLATYRNFLDAAGLRLDRWPRIRILSLKERRRIFKTKLKDNSEPKHVKKAMSLVHRYERILRQTIDRMMTEAYGEEWPEARLPLCGCKTLLGRWQKRGGEVLDHADYAHYALIMSHSEHFEDIFELGFDCPAALAKLLNDAGRLRAASHHAHPFTPKDLLDLRVVWKTIEIGLMAFTEIYEFNPS